MRIERRFTTADQSPYAALEFRATKSEIRNPDGSVVFSLDGIDVPAGLEPGRGRRHRPEILPQGRRPGAAEARRRKTTFPPSSGAACRTRRHLPAFRKTSASGRKCRPGRSSTGSPAPGPTGAGRAAISTARRCRGLHGRTALYAGPPDGGAQLAAMVQHRPALGLRHRRAEPGPPFRGLSHGRAPGLAIGLRAPAAARLLHPGRAGRPRQRGRHHGPVGARGAPVQVRLRHRLQLLQAARRERAPLGRRQVVRPDELPQDRRPRGRRHQVRRHHAPRRQDGLRRRSTIPTSRPSSTGR